VRHGRILEERGALRQHSVVVVVLLALALCRRARAPGGGAP
jgi:hypothetical protein